jgi:FkbM family methyltransferase
MMKEGIKSVLKRLNVYHQLKYSPLFRLYERVFKPQIIAQHKKEVSLYQSFLHSPALIFDIGAYDGHKTAAFAEISSKVISCEPDPDSFRILSDRFRHCKNKVHLLNCAVYDKQGEALLQRNVKGSAFNTLNTEWSDILQRDRGERWSEKIKFDESISVVTKTTTLDHLIEQFGLPDFIKVDVEGSELQVMRGLTKKIRAVSFECLLPEFKSQLLEILAKLLSMDSSYHFNIIYNEELLLPGAVSYDEILQWIEKTGFHCFDMLAIVENDRFNS